MLSRMVFVGLLAIAPSQIAQALCGDCDLDGAVRINELIEAVNGALGTTTVPTPLPNRCPAFAPGVRYESPSGRRFVVIEVPVYLEGSAAAFRVRYPVQLDDQGNVPYVQPAIYLARETCVADALCGGDPLTLCGFSAHVRSRVDPGQQLGYFESGSATKTASLTASAAGHATYAVRLEPGYEPLYLDVSASARSVTVQTTPVSGVGYSFADGPYSATRINLRQLEDDVEALQRYVSIRRF